MKIHYDITYQSSYVERILLMYVDKHGDVLLIEHANGILTWGYEYWNYQGDIFTIQWINQWHETL